jgi:lysophospholipase L1-like esterase
MQPHNPHRPTGLTALLLLALIALGTLSPLAHASSHHRHAAKPLPICPSTRWIESWQAAPSDDASAGDARLVSFAHGPSQTLRMIITPHYAGSLVRVRLSNAFGSAPLTVDATALADSQSGPALIPGTSHAVLFNGQPTVTIPAGGGAVSDPVSITVSAFQNLAVSVYLQNSYIPTEHFSGRQISYGTLPLAGNHVTDPAGSAFTQTTTARYLLSGLDVQAAGNAGTVVTFGDSITDGYQGGASLVPETSSTLNLNARYPDWLARRLLTAHIPLAVANAGISGNRILQNGQIPMFGPSALSRFTPDAIDVPGVTTIIILEGTNDIGQSNATASQIITGLTQLVGVAKAAHIRVLLGTLTPMAQATEPGTYSGTASNAIRMAVNAWISTQHIADGYIDFSRAVADPSDPSTIAPAYNGGDGLHFTPAGYRALADAINLTQLRGPTCAAPALKLTVRPRRVTATKRTVLRFQVTVTLDGKNVPVAAAVIHIGRRPLRTDRRGRASVVVRFPHSTRLRIHVTARGYTPAATTIHVVKRRR